MTKRPAPRRSNLAGANPVAPTTATETPTPATPAPVTSAATSTGRRPRDAEPPPRAHIPPLKAGLQRCGSG